MITLTRGSRIITSETSTAVLKAVADLTRDLSRVFGPGAGPGAPLRLFHTPMATEDYQVVVRDGSLVINGGDDLGLIYGLYAVSREVLGIHDLWFWNDQQIAQRSEITLPADFRLDHADPVVRFRGLFLNDEVLLSDWSVVGDADLPWEYAFETILRLGGNFVIPGSGQRGETRFEQAHQRGLYLGQHHATPLGARMFAECYPDDAPQWPEKRGEFEALWRSAIQERAHQKMLWTLGFRGQGDLPFWENDPRYVTDEERGAVLTEVIALQYDLVQTYSPGAPCCVYLYGEAMQLYEAGLLGLADSLLIIWSDNGYGAMVSRRQGNSDPRTPSMPDPARDAPQGIYYHASFYDLQAGNHITQLCVPPQRVAQELTTVLDRGGTGLWVVNASNIKPHVFFLALIAQLWRTGRVDVPEFQLQYATAYYGEAVSGSLAAAFTQYWQAAIQFGPHWDNRAGEQFLNHVPRTLAVQFMTRPESASEELHWFSDATGLGAQVQHFQELCQPAEPRYQALVNQLERDALKMAAAPARRPRDSILLQSEVYLHCVRAANLLCEGLNFALAHDYKAAFYRAGLAREEYLAANQRLRDREHGKWHNFWRNECLTDVKQSAWVIQGLMSYLRAHGDGPHYFEWKREFCYPQHERNVMLVLNMENHETDDEIFAAMKAKWQD